MTYRVVKEDKEYQVVEKDTQLVVRSVRREKVARELCRDLNLGAGFNGWTPRFFCNSLK